MTRVDFYILDDAAADARARFACRIAEKAYAGGHKVYLHAPDPQTARQLDDLLWTFRQGSFVPHDLLGTDADPETPIHVGSGNDPGHHDDVLVNLADEVPQAFFSRFERVAEVVGGDETAKQQGRQRFRFYRERGYELQTHTIRRS